MCSIKNNVSLLNAFPYTCMHENAKKATRVMQYSCHAMFMPKNAKKCHFRGLKTQKSTRDSLSINPAEPEEPLEPVIPVEPV